MWHRKPKAEPESSPADTDLRCSFCNKSQRDVKKLIAGPTVYICDECVDICLDIIAEDRVLEEEPSPEALAALAAAPTTDCSVCGRRTVPIDVPKDTVICLSCIWARWRGSTQPKR